MDRDFSPTTDLSSRSSAYRIWEWGDRENLPSSDWIIQQKHLLLWEPENPPHNYKRRPPQTQGVYPTRAHCDGLSIVALELRVSGMTSYTASDLSYSKSYNSGV